MSGRLSLRHINTSQIYKNHLDVPSAHAVVDGFRHSACVFETNTEDFRVKGAHGDSNAMIQLVEKSVGPSVFEGKIYWWLKEDHERGPALLKWVKYKWNRFVKKKQNTLFDTMAPLYSDLIEEQNSEGIDAGKWKTHWRKILNTAQDFQANFRLEVDFQLRDDGIMRLSSAKRSHKGNTSMLTGDQDKTAVRQSFYMLKQCLHLHKHHDTSDDALTTAHLLDESIENSGVTLLNDLKVSLIDFHRSIFGKYSMVDKVNGISTYALSLSQTLLRNGLITEAEKNSQDVYFKNIEASIATTARTLRYSSDEKIARLENRRNLTLLALAVMSPQVIMYRHHLEAFATTDSLIFKILSNTLPHLSFWVIALGLYIIWPHLRFNAWAKEFLISLGWGVWLRKRWYRTSKKQDSIVNIVSALIGLALIALGIHKYWAQI